ncbi:MAG: hypothetical protein ABIP94_19070 [Planctomycetota bacterium]
MASGVSRPEVAKSQKQRDDSSTTRATAAVLRPATWTSSATVALANAIETASVVK